MAGKTYSSFSDVENDARSGLFANEPDLRQALVEALKNEINRYCGKNPVVVDHIFKPMLERVVEGKRRADIMFSNVVIEVKKPEGLSQGRQQLYQYMADLRSRAGMLVIHGVVTDGVDAEYYVLDNTGFKLVIRGGLSDVMGGLLTSFCAQKIPIVTPEELLSIVGI